MVSASEALLRQHEQIQTRDPEQGKRGQRRVCYPRRRHSAAARQSNEFGDDLHGERDRHPTVNLPNPSVPVQSGLLGVPLIYLDTYILNGVSPMCGIRV